jgi:hypothetical protein
MRLLRNLPFLASFALAAIQTPVAPISCVPLGSPLNCALHWFTNTGYIADLKDPKSFEVYAIATLYDPNCKQIFTTENGLAPNQVYNTTFESNFILNSHAVDDSVFGVMDLPTWTFMVHNYDGETICECFPGKGYHDCRCPFQCL